MEEYTSDIIIIIIIININIIIKILTVSQCLLYIETMLDFVGSSDY